jgi:hypothetical protein
MLGLSPDLARKGHELAIDLAKSKRRESKEVA